MYTLYHLKGNKWGMTRRTLNQRFSDKDYRKKGLTINDVCETETYSDRDTAADRERELNIRDGYGWNKSQDYRIISKAGKIGGNNRAAKLTDEEKGLIGTTLGKYPSYHLRKLDYQKAEYIRAQYKRGKDVFDKKITMQRLANVFGVVPVTIHDIIHNKRYTTP